MRSRRQMLALIGAALLLLLAPASASKAEPVRGSGTFTVASAVVTGSRVVDGNTFLTTLVTSAYTGTLQGTGVAEEAAAVHPDGGITVQTFETFTGTVNGDMGTALFRVVGSADAATGALSGHFTIVGGTGGLANLRGQGTFQGVGTSGTYTVDTHFDPAP